MSRSLPCLLGLLLFLISCLPFLARLRGAGLALPLAAPGLLLLRVDENLFFANYGLRHGIYTYKGCLTNHYLGRRFNIKSTDLDLLITSDR